MKSATHLIALAAVTLALAGCNVGLGHSSTSTPLSAPAPEVTAASQLITEPDATITPIYQALASPTHTLDLEMYELVDTHATAILAADAARGVHVRVVLDHNREAHANTPAYDYLTTHGVSVAWAPSNYTADHEKAFVIDNATTYIMSLNLTSRYYASTRDFAISDTNPSDVAAVEAVFFADLTGSPITPAPASSLVWSPTTSQATLLAMINGAHHTLSIENEEMASSDVIAAIAAAAHRGVTVDLTMTNSASWTTAFDQLAAAGVHIAVYAPNAPLYIHAKVIVSDVGQTTQAAFVGSQNFSTASLDYNRELGLVTTFPGLVSSLDATLASDFSTGQAWSH